jgi:subtilisin family serine protease
MRTPSVILAVIVVALAAASTAAQIGHNLPGATSLRRGWASQQTQRTLGMGAYNVHVKPRRSAQSNYLVSRNAATTTTTPDRIPASGAPYFGDANDWNLNAINAPQVWARGYTGSGVIVAVIDSGVDYRHAELVNNMWVNPGEIAGNGRDDDRNGYVDDDRGWDFAHDDNNPLDVFGHGTHVAGTIAAARNDARTTGVAYGARIMPVQVLDANGIGDGDDSLAAAIRYAVNNGADIINVSVWWNFSPAIVSALNYAGQMGVFVVAASGDSSGSMPAYPAHFSGRMSHVISVGAHTSSNSLFRTSKRLGTRGAVKIDAPGANVYSTLPGNRYGHRSGTSMAAPHVAGVAALALSANPTLTPSQLRQVLVAGSNRYISGSDSRGGVDAALVVPRR